MKKRTLSSVAVVLAAACVCGQSYAANPLVGIVEGENWDLPIVPSASLFIQSGMAQRNVQDYDTSGNTKPSASGGTSVEGMTRFAHAFSFQSIPDIGFLIEAFQPEISSPSGNGNTMTGLGDPFVHMLAYKRFLDNSLLLGVGNIVSIPVGSNEVSNHAWIDAPNLVADYKIGNLGFDGTLAAAYLSRVGNGCTAQIGCAQPGNLYTAEGAVRYVVTPWFVPFVSYTVQNEDHGHFTGAPIVFPGSREGDLGVGARFPIDHLRWFSIWYYDGLNGSNTAKSNAVYLKFATGL
jgi:hypothetical protein